MDFDGIFLKKELCSRSPKSPQNHRVVFFFRVFFCFSCFATILKVEVGAGGTCGLLEGWFADGFRCVRWDGLSVFLVERG